MDTAATGDTFDISNLDRLGKSEVNVGDKASGGVERGRGKKTPHQLKQ